MATLVTQATNVGHPPVNFELIRGALAAGKAVAPFYWPTLKHSLMRNGGVNAVKWERIENLATATTALSVPATLTLPFSDSVRPTLTPVTATVDKYGNSMVIEDELELQSVHARSAMLMMTLGENAGRSLNEILEQAAYTNATLSRLGSDAASVAALAENIIANDIRAITTQLDANEAMKFFPLGAGSQNVGTLPIHASYFGICHTRLKDDMRALTGFVPVEQYAAFIAPIPGEFGYFNDVRWCETTISSIVNADAATTPGAGHFSTAAADNDSGTSLTADVYTSYIVGREAVGSVGLGEQHTDQIYMTGDKPATVEFIVKPLGSAGAGDPLNQVATIGWKAWFAGAILNDNWIGKIETLATNWT